MKIALGAVVAASAAGVLSSDLHVAETLADRLSVPAVRVVIVDDPAWLRQTRDSLRRERIVGERPGAFALEGGRVYARSHTAASEIVNAQGWGDRKIVFSGSQLRALERLARLSERISAAHVRWTLRSLALIGGAFALAGIHGLWRERRYGRDLAAAHREAPVLVLRMADRAEVDAVRASVARERIVAEREDAFATGDGWIVTCSDDGASRLMRRAGWRNRILASHRPDPFGSAARRDDYSIDTGPEFRDEKYVWSPREAILAVARAPDFAPGGPLHGFATAPLDV